MFEEEEPKTIEEKKALLIRNRIALWDVIQSCDIVGSADSSITNVVPNDFLCSQNPSNGMSDQVMHVFGAKVDSEGRIKDTDEVADKVWMPIAEVKELLRNNQTKDGMLEKFGYGLQYLRDINAFAKDNASDADVEKVIRTAEEIKKYIESAN